MKKLDLCATAYFTSIEGICFTTPCENGGSCESSDGVEYTCDCTGTGYYGDDCETGRMVLRCKWYRYSPDDWSCVRITVCAPLF